MDKSKIKKIVLAYSGGLDTSVIIPWLKEHYNDPEIIAVAADVGQGDELDGLEEKAIKTGASKLIIADLTDEMCDDIIVPSVMMDAKYEKYLLGTAFARPVIGKKLAEIALAEGADAIAHGATGKGNDQVRFELAIKRFAPDMAIIALLQLPGARASGARHDPRKVPGHRRNHPDPDLRAFLDVRQRRRHRHRVLSESPSL